jgi:predicted membrane-bound mannosyltransferase
VAGADSAATPTARADDRARCWRHAALALAAAGVVWLLFFSSFFTNWSGLLDSFRTYLPWLKRAGGASPHIHPWYFYLERLAWFQPPRSPVWSEGLILVLAAVGAGVSLLGKKSALHRFLAVYTLALTAIYSVISYKTPWCLLSFWQGMILLAGVGAAAVLDAIRARWGRITTGALLAALTAQLAWQAWRGSFVFFADRRNPYVYAQTVPHLLKLVERVEAVADAAPTGRETVVQVVAPDHDYGPLPWYLRRFQHVGWYDQLPDDLVAPIVVVAARLDARLDEKSDRRWLMVGLFEQRPGVFLELYVEKDLWMRFVGAMKREAESE